MRYKKLLRIGFILHFIIFTALFHTRAALADEAASLEELQELLSKGLTIYEIDQEVMRLTNREDQLAVQIEDVTGQAEDQEVLVSVKREQAGKVLRAYYKGDRDHLWLLILNADNFYEALQVYYYLSLIYKHEQKILQEHADTYQQLQRLLEQLQTDRTELQHVKAEYLAQRARLVALQEELDRELAAREDGDAILSQIEALTRIWETKGLPVFKHYFNELANAINKLPEEIVANGNVSLQNGRFLLSITDAQLTDFFRAYNPDDFEQFTFSFAEDDFTAFGASDDTAISIKGNYELLEEENIISFELSRLVYNGIELPDTTLRAMNEEFDLNFYPDYLTLPFKVKATDVTIQEGTLSIAFVLQR